MFSTFWWTSFVSPQVGYPSYSTRHEWLFLGTGDVTSFFRDLWYLLPGTLMSTLMEDTSCLPAFIPPYISELPVASTLVESLTILLFSSYIWPLWKSELIFHIFSPRLAQQRYPSILSINGRQRTRFSSDSIGRMFWLGSQEYVCPSTSFVGGDGCMAQCTQVIGNVHDQ